MKKNTKPSAVDNQVTALATAPDTSPVSPSPAPQPEPETAAESPVTENHGEETSPPAQAADGKGAAISSTAVADDIEARLAEAENRGYMRGRNERIAELMREPALFERQAAPSSPAGQSAASLCQGGDSAPDSQPMILNNPRVSIWDR